MTIHRMEHVGIVVDDLAARLSSSSSSDSSCWARGRSRGRWVDRIVGLDGVRVDHAMVQTPDGNGQLELVKFHSPSTQGGNRDAPANIPGIRHIAFAVEDIDAVVASLRARGTELVGEVVRYEDIYRLCYVRGRRGSSSSWPSRSADGSGPPPTPDQPERPDSRSATGSLTGTVIVVTMPLGPPGRWVAWRGFWAAQ